MLKRQYCVYIMTNPGNTVLYVGVTSRLSARTYEHAHHLVEGFSATYNTCKLVYYECTSDVLEALQREKQFKRWRRAWKEKCITEMNPTWKDLAEELS
ncbi:MAG: GIY-YIG nuclease family protein [Patescibacteria group bacterium]